MTTRIQLKLGDISVEYEGSESFLEKKLPELLLELCQSMHKVQKATTAPVSQAAPKTSSPVADKSSHQAALSKWLQQCQAMGNQNRRFLAVAAWLQNKGKDRLRTLDITRTLRENDLEKLSNPSQSLNSNVRQGHCRKQGKHFMVNASAIKWLKQ